MGDGQDLQNDADQSAELAEVVAFLGDEGPDIAPTAPPAADSGPESSHTVAEGGGVTLESVVPAVEPIPQNDAIPPAAAEPIDPEIAALQADLDAEAGEPRPAEETAEPVAAGAVEAEEAAEPETAEAPVAETAPVAVHEIDGESADSKQMALPDDRAGVPLWPFLVYFGLWVVFAGLLIWQFMQTPAGTPVYEVGMYGASILAGLVLTVLGPLVAIAVWIFAWLSRPGARAGLFSRSLIIGAVTTLAGVALWLIALGAIDMLRLGRLL